MKLNRVMDCLEFRSRAISPRWTVMAANVGIACLRVEMLSWARDQAWTVVVEVGSFERNEMARNIRACRAELLAAEKRHFAPSVS